MQYCTLYYRPHPKDGEGNVFSLSTLGGVPISHNALQHFPECHEAATGGYPYPIMLCNISPECHGAATGGGYPARSSWGGYPAGGYPGRGYPGGGYPAWGGTQVRYPPARSAGGVPGGGTLAGGVPRSGTPQPGQLGGGVPCQGRYPGQDNIGSTCYMAGGMPLAFTQEYFLVSLMFRYIVGNKE